MATMSAAHVDRPPQYPLNGEEERTRFRHHIEHQFGWQYRTTSVPAAAYPDGWDYMATQPPGWELNVDRWPLVDEVMEDATRVAPGLILKPKIGKLVAHWRRKVVPDE